MSKGTNWGTVALVVGGLLLWNDGCAGKAATTAIGTGAAVGAASGAAGGAASAGAAAAAASRAGSRGGGNTRNRTQAQRQRPSTEAICPSGISGTLGVCVVPGVAQEGRTDPVAPGGGDCRMEPRRRTLMGVDADGDGQDDQITLPELTCGP